jgi:antitoxin (DNA-binding transcriptional repressor) of toxin-antitoxin stability system
MVQVNVHEAKTTLSKLLERVEQGEEVVIARNGTPVARLSRYTAKRPFHEIFGSLEGQVWMADDWDSQDANRTAYGDAWEGLEQGPSE